MYYFSCPCCKSNTRFYRVRQASDTGNIRLLVFLLGGLLASVLFGRHERRTRVQCAHCGFVFVKPALGRSPVATTAMLIFFGILVAGVLGVVVEHYPEVFASIPGWPYVLLLGDFVTRHPTGVAAALLAGVIFTGLLSSGIAVIANARHHHRIRAEYEHEPSEFPPHPTAKRPPVEPPSECTSCGYNLTGNESGVCPECGVPTGGATRTGCAT